MYVYRAKVFILSSPSLRMKSWRIAKSHEKVGEGVVLLLVLLVKH